LGDFIYASYGNEVSYEYLESQIFEQDCFTTRRLIVVNDWPQPKGPKDTMIKHFKKMLEHVPHDHVVILNNLPTKGDSFRKHIAKIGQVRAFDQWIPQSTAADWARRTLESKEKSIAADQSEMLVQSVGVKEGTKDVDVDRLHMLIRRLCDYVGNRKKIKDEDIQNVCTDSPDFIVWNLINLLDDGNYRGCLTLTNQLLSKSTNTEKSIVQVIHTLLWRYRLLMFVKESLSHSWDSPRIVCESRLILRMERSGSGLKTFLRAARTDKGDVRSVYPDSVVGRSMEGYYKRPPPISNYTRQRLYEIMRALIDTLFRIRKGVTEEGVLVLFDLLLMTICGDGNEDNIRKTRMVRMKQRKGN